MIRTGIDKVRIRTREFLISEDAPLRIERGTFNLQTGYEVSNTLFLRKGKPVQGKKAYLNTDLFSLNIDRYGLSLSFNPSILEHGKGNIVPSTYNGLKEATKAIQIALEKHGIYSDIHSFQWSRLDLQRTARMNHPFDFYRPLFESLRGKRMEGVRYSSTYDFRNKSRQVSFYDKIREMNSRDFETSVFHPNQLRVELRMMNKNTVQKCTCSPRFGDILNESAYEQLDDCFKEEVNKIAFGKLELDKSPPLHSNTQLLKNIKAQKSRGSFNEFLLTLMIEEILQTLRGPKEIEKLMLETGFSKDSVYREIKKMNMRISKKSLLLSDSTDSSMIQMFEEFYSKFLDD